MSDKVVVSIINVANFKFVVTNLETQICMVLTLYWIQFHLHCIPGT
jgi:hypothetical protein